MTENNKNKNTFSTCLEDLPFAEMMQKMMGRQGIGSLCAKMMQMVGEKKDHGARFSCSEMIQSMTKGCCGRVEETNETKKEEDHVEEK